MTWIPPALTRLRHPCRSVLPRAAFTDMNGWHLPHFAFGSSRPDCSTCGSGYPCRVVRRRALRWVLVEGLASIAGAPEIWAQLLVSVEAIPAESRQTGRGSGWDAGRGFGWEMGS